MRQRIGMILSIAGIGLLLMPKVDWQPILATLYWLGKEHWPFGLVVLGLLLLRPHKRKRKS